jgi:hypothetical protein
MSFARVRDERHGRPEEMQRHAVVETPLESRARINDRQPLRARRFQRDSVGMSAVTLSAIGKLGHPDSSQHGRDAACVIAVRMRQHDGVESMNAASQQKRYDDAVADRFGAGIVALASAFQPAARIDEKRVARRRLHHDGVGLSHIEHRDA